MLSVVSIMSVEIKKRLCSAVSEAFRYCDCEMWIVGRREDRIHTLNVITQVDTVSNEEILTKTVNKGILLNTILK